MLSNTAIFFSEKDWLGGKRKYFFSSENNIQQDKLFAHQNSKFVEAYKVKNHLLIFP